MPASANQLDEIYKQLKEQFISHPWISVAPIKGDPPEQYEITYMLNGLCKTREGKIVESENHRVELVIPFGFPHFPPSCKPKGDIFHPDFDPAAICLGDFWHQERSLSDLIIHIGKMINGEFYSTTNAFNEKAAVWYQNNRTKFPLTRITWATANGSQPSDDNAQCHPIDTLDDEDLTTDFDFLALDNEKPDEEIILNTSFPEVHSSSVLDLEFFTQLERQRKYYTLLQSGENCGHPSDTLKDMVRKARDKIELVEKLHRDAKKFEKKGEDRIAFEKYQQIATIVADFPAIDSDIHRIQQTLTLDDDLHPKKRSDVFDPDVPVESPVADKSPLSRKKAAVAATEQATSTKKHAPENVFLAKKHHKNRLFLSLLFGILAIAMGSGGYFWFSINTTLGKAETASAECFASLADKQFKAAERLCTHALQLAAQVKFIHQDTKQQLEKSLRHALQSEDYIQGLAGNILYDGKYIPANEAEKRQATQQLLLDANALFRDGEWSSAEQLFTELLAQTENSGHFDRPIIDDIQHKRLIAEFRMSYDPAQRAIQDSHWEEAIEKLLQAQKVLMSLPESDREQYSVKLQEALHKSQFANLKEQGDLSFTGADWLSAIAAYNLALNRGQEAALSPESIDAIKNNIKRAELYTTINKGNKAFALGAWDEAIAAYNQASHLLSESRTMPSTADSDVNILKLDRIILQASIIRDRQTVQTLLDNNEFAQARRIYRQIITNIAGSALRAEEEFFKTETEIKTAMQALDDQLFLSEKIDYLKNNFRSLFVANYTSAIPENLINPVISNTKKTESQLIFRMQCTETGGGRPLTLVMFYAYNTKTGRWSLFSES